MTKSRGTKATAMACAAALILSLAACGAEEAPSGTVGTTTTAAAANKAETTAAATTTKAEATTEATTTAETTTEATTTEPEEPPVQETSAEDFDYTDENGEITITKYKGSDEEVVIPATIDGKPVTVIGGNAFVSHKSMKSVVIPDGVTVIGECAFLYCVKLENITIPESVKEFKDDRGDLSPFNNTLWLENQRAENPLVIVNNVVVDGRTCTRSVTIPEGVTHIADGAFYNCTTLTSADLPNSVEKIGDYAFSGCSRLTEIVLPDSVSAIGQHAFDACGLTEIVLPDSVSAIGDYAFFDCNSLENVTFPNHAVEMGNSVFMNAHGDGCPWLKNKRAEDPLVIVNNNLIDARTICGGSWLPSSSMVRQFDNDAAGDVVIPDSVQSIAGGAFYNSGVKSVRLPDGITKIPDFLFAADVTYARLSSITIPDSVTEIGAKAFYGCDSLTSVTIPDSVTEIGASAFSGCSILASITIPDGVTVISDSAFSGCGYLESITIPDSVTEIGVGAFSKCRNLTSVTLPDSVTEIGANAFSGCGLTSITLPDGLESLGKDAFNNCDVTYKGEIYFPELYDELYEAINGAAE